MDLKKKGEIFENQHGQLLFICCICNASNMGMMDVEAHLKTHIEFVLSTVSVSDNPEILGTAGTDYKNEICIKVERHKYNGNCRNKVIQDVSENPVTGQQPSSDKDIKVSEIVINNSIITNKPGPRQTNRQFLPSFHQYHCDICNQTFGTKTGIRSHMSCRHMTVRPYQCHLCGRKFTDPRNITRHLYRHYNVKKFGCDECGKTFVTSTELKTHIKHHTGEKNFLCTTCGRGFITSGELVNHDRHNHKRERRYKCDYTGCNRAFFKPHKLKLHNRTHTGERPFICDTCNKAFAMVHLLKNHQNLHNADKMFKCKFCPKTFAQPSGRWGHERQVHGTGRPRSGIIK